MNYIELINHFWQTNRTSVFTKTEAYVYFALVNECNLRKWENPFECSNKSIVGNYDVNEDTLITARNRLKQKGMINFENGKKREKSPVYTIMQLNIDDTCFNSNFSGKNPSKSAGKNPSKNPSKKPNSFKTETKTEEEENILKEILPKSEIEIAFENFNKYLDEECPNIRKLKRQMSLKEYEKLKNKFTSEKLTDKLNGMENKADLTKKYTSVYLTLNNWVKND